MVRDTRDADLSRCLRDALAAEQLPARPPGTETLTLPIEVAAKPFPFDPIVRTPVPPLSDSGVAFAEIRAGSVGTRGVGGAGIHDLAEFYPARLIIEGQAEVGVTDQLQSIYVARALIGLGGVSAAGAMLAVVTGVGVSRYGDPTPGAIEIPFVAHFGFSAHDVHYSLSVRSTVFPTEKLRQVGRFGGDEVAAGVGVSFPIAGARVYLGGSIERRIAGTSAVVVVGLPIGRLF